MVDSSIDDTGAHRLELRAVSSAQNGLFAARGNRVPSSFVKSVQVFDHLWSILSTDRRDAKAVWGPKVH